MTSELLIMTPSAVVLAADSAVTVGNRKTYTGVNKLFMLVNNPSFGIMTYNLAAFLNIPIETLIKNFRESIKENEKLSNVEDFENEFQLFLKNILINHTISYSFEEKLDAFLNSIKESPIYMNFLEEYVGFIINNMPDGWNFDFLGENRDEVIKNLRKNEDKFINIMPDNFKDNSEMLENLKKIFVYDEFHESYTGIVIAGFNRNDLFPSYVEFKINYLFDDKILFQKISEDRITGNNVIIKPFAQGDVIETFLDSIDKNTENKLLGYVNKIYNDYDNKLKEAILNNSNLNDDEKSKMLKELEKINDNTVMLDNKFKKYINSLKKTHKQPIINSLAALPKEGLSNLAESLINITSLKRKVQNDLQSVGGPVDVAIITHGDGFIWTKRKHYFSPDLNPQFFER